MKYLIKWQKWRDPFGGDLEDSEMPLITSDEIEDNEDDEGFETTIKEEDYTEKFHELMKQKPVKIIQTPLGIVPINEYTQPSKLFKFWTGHTNFNITAKIVNLIDIIEGVESLDVFSRYRMRIGVGHAFNDGDTLRKIDKAVEKYYDSKQKKKSLPKE